MMKFKIRVRRVGLACLFLLAVAQVVFIPARAGEILGDAEWPVEWVVFAPAGRDAPDPPAGQLRSVPRVLTVGEREIEAREVKSTDLQYDFRPLFGENPVRETAYVYLVLNSPSDHEATLGFGADWWMRVWVNGDVPLDTREDGNEHWPPTINDHRVNVTLRKGENVIVIKYLGGVGSSILAAAGPRELRSPLPQSLIYSQGERDRAAREMPDVDLSPTSGWAERFRRSEVEPERARVRLRTDWADNTVSGASVSFGVPFARNAVRTGRNVRLLDAAGREVPAEFRPTATWAGPDGPVRWALVSARLSAGVEYWLEYGAEVSRGEPEGMTVTETEGEIVINTGSAEFTVSREIPSVVHTVALLSDGGDRDYIVTAADSAAALPALVDGAGNVYRASGEELKVEVVERGPMRTAVRREGWYRSADGAGFCQFIIYTYFQYGEAGFRHDHTLVVGFNTHEHTIREIMLPVPLNIEGERRAWFAGDGSSNGSLVERNVGEESLSLVQTGNRTWSLVRGEALEATGERAGGWFGLADDRWGAFVGIEHFWQNYPAELEVSGRSLNLHLYASRLVEPLDFRPSEILGRRGEPYPGTRVFFADLYRRGLDEMTQGYGLGKTHSARYVFFRAPARAAAAAAARLVNQPVIAFADPAWASATEAFRRVRHHDAARFPEIEAILDAIVHRRLWLRERLENYGWFHFGDINGNLSDAGNPDRVAYRDWRRWASMFYGNPNVMPLLFMRSGRRDAWDFHRVNTRHITDIDLCHLDHGGFRKSKGRRYGGDGGIVHFAAGLYGIGCDSHLRFMLWDHYLNGNLRAREVAEYYVEAHAALTTHPSQLRYNARHTGGALRLFTEAYEATWKPEYLAIMRQYADVLYRAAEERGTTQYNDVYMNEGKVFYYQVTGDERMRDLFLNDMRVLVQRRDAHVFNDSRATTMYGLSHAYLMTGNPKFLPFALWQLDVARERMVTGGEPGRVGAVGWTLEFAYNATLANQLPTVMATLAVAGDDVDERRSVRMYSRSGRTRGALHLRQETDRDIDLAVEIDVYTGVARRFSNWADWVARLPEGDRPGLALIDPDGREVQRLPLTRSGMIFVRHPADGRTGVYTLQPVSRATPLSLRLFSADHDGFVLDAADASMDLGPDVPLYFRVPAGTGEFSVRIKTAAMRGSNRVEFFDALGAKRAGEEIPAQRTWRTVTLDAGRPAGDEVWSLSLSPAAETFLDVDGVPGHVSLDMKALFDPGRTWSAPQPPGEPPGGTKPTVYADAGPDGIPAVAIPSGVGAEVASPVDDKALADASRGTVEMWLMCHRRPHEIQDRDYLRLGGLRISRRAEIGTYTYIGAPSFQTGFVLPADRWTHLALTWEPHSDGGVLATLFADGVRVETNDARRLEIPGDWPGALEIPAGEAGLSVAGLRISNVARYARDFTPPGKTLLEPDDAVVLLWPVDEDGSSWFGKREISSDD